MKRIYKYLIGVGATQTVYTYKNAVVLHAGLDPHGRLAVWMLVNTKNPMTEITFNVYGTGLDLPQPEGNYVGSILDGEYIWHVFKMND